MSADNSDQDFVVRALRAGAKSIQPPENGLHQALSSINVTSSPTLRYNQRSAFAHQLSDFFKTMEQRWKLWVPATLIPVAIIAAVIVMNSGKVSTPVTKPTVAVVAQSSPETVAAADALSVALTNDLLVEDASLPDEAVADQAYINANDSAQFDGI